MNKRLFISFSALVLIILATFLKNPLIHLLYHPSPVDPNNIIQDYDQQAKTGIFNNQTVNIPSFLINHPIKNTHVLGESNTLSKRIEVDLKKQRLYAYEGSFLRFSFIISSGKWNSTPDGNFKIWAKVKSQKMSGGSKELGTYYYLPNVPYIMFFYNETTKKKLGYSFHGTYWHHNFGQPMSHGCINMITSDAKQLYEWSEIGTPIKIYNRFSVTK